MTSKTVDMFSLWSLRKYWGPCPGDSGGSKAQVRGLDGKGDFGIINISMVLAVMTLNEITQEECEKQEK